MSDPKDMAKDTSVPITESKSVEEGQVFSTDSASHAIALENYAPGSGIEKRLVRKLDFIVLPSLWWMYILSYLDRGNIVSTIRRHA